MLTWLPRCTMNRSRAAEPDSQWFSTQQVAQGQPFALLGRGAFHNRGRRDCAPSAP